MLYFIIKNTHKENRNDYYFLNRVLGCQKLKPLYPFMGREVKIKRVLDSRRLYHLLRDLYHRKGLVRTPYNLLPILKTQLLKHLLHIPETADSPSILNMTGNLPGYIASGSAHGAAASSPNSDTPSARRSTLKPLTTCSCSLSSPER